MKNTVIKVFKTKRTGSNSENIHVRYQCIFSLNVGVTELTQRISSKAAHINLLKFVNKKVQQGDYFNYHLILNLLPFLSCLQLTWHASQQH